MEYEWHSKGQEFDSPMLHFYREIARSPDFFIVYIDNTHFNGAGQES